MRRFEADETIGGRAGSPAAGRVGAPSAGGSGSPAETTTVCCGLEGALPTNVTTAMSSAGDPVPVTVLAVPLLVKTNPFVPFAVKWQIPSPGPAGEIDTVHSVFPVGPVTTTVVSAAA